jgi:hypothetical protein
MVKLLPKKRGQTPEARPRSNSSMAFAGPYAVRIISSFPLRCASAACAAASRAIGNR